MGEMIKYGKYPYRVKGRPTFALVAGFIFVAGFTLVAGFALVAGFVLVWMFR
jgi:hypothetical protein